MRILDRYLVRSFLEPLIVATAFLSGLYLVADAFGNLDDFLSQAETLREALLRMARVYTLRVPFYVAEILPIGMLVGASYGVSQLSAHSELIAMRACGVSLWRILAPVYALAVALAFLGLLNREYVVPRVEAATARDRGRWAAPGSPARRCRPRGCPR